MQLQQLILKHFRCFDTFTWTIQKNKKLNVFVGPNGSGKTSLLEAIYLLSTGQSFRATQLKALIKEKSQHMQVTGVVEDFNGFPCLLEVSKAVETALNVAINGTKVVRSALSRYLPAQLFTTQALDLIIQGPAERRERLDWGCFFHYPHYGEAWKRAKRLLQHRNALLKQGAVGEDLKVWDQAFASITEEVQDMRSDYFEAWKAYALDYCATFLPKYRFKLTLFKGWNKHESYLNQLRKAHRKDTLLGYTSLGLHKADFLILVQDQPAADYLSRGETKLLAMAFYFSQTKMLWRFHKRKTLHLIDDAHAELDQGARVLFWNQLLSEDAQVFFTTTSSQWQATLPFQIANATLHLPGLSEKASIT